MPQKIYSLREFRCFVSLQTTWPRPANMRNWKLLFNLCGTFYLWSIFSIWKSNFSIWIKIFSKCGMKIPLKYVLPKMQCTSNLYCTGEMKIDIWKFHNRIIFYLSCLEECVDIVNLIKPPVCNRWKLWIVLLHSQ